LVGASVAASVAYNIYAAGVPAPTDASFGVGTAGAAIFCLLAQSKGSYRLRNLLKRKAAVTGLVQIFAISVLVLVCLLFLLKIGEEYSRGTMALFAAFGLAAVLAGRRVLAAAFGWAVDTGIIKGRPVIAIGDPREMERLGAFERLQFGIEELARVTLIGEDVAGALSVANRERVSYAVETARRMRATEFALLMPWGRDHALVEVISLLRASPLPVRLYPDYKLRNMFRREMGGDFDPDFSVLLQREPLSRPERLIKRALDIAISGSALLLISPLLLITAALIKLDSRGPVIFKQRRGGFDNREFVIFKFRTMTVLEESGKITQARRDDDRVTRFGRVLRRTSLDEIPQLFNVLRGDMSLVGPRPHAVAHDDEYRARIANYALRHHVKPGLTGKAQVTGLRGATPRLADMEQRVEWDLWYINNWSLWLDLRLLVKTAVTVFSHDAY
jgi:undecaprenyl-phosphate galactose phosphotransferase/putative colanic acid biosynthesis UDP-glucose lipid carrier transferase